jgi:methylphosphotriester-DNA--protein-cysteine methyltransferase
MLSADPRCQTYVLEVLIYGRLDCPSALRWIEKGHYVEHRVFFADEATAIAAGYRPCAKCLPNQYREWKETHSA